MKHKILLLLAISTVIINCKKKDNRTFESVDLSVSHKYVFNSFKIGIDGKAIVLTSNINEIPRLYQVAFNENEIIYIENALSNINLKKCDSLDYTVCDGTRYIFIVNNVKDTLTLVSNTCKQLKKLDNLVLYIEKTINKKEKTYYYKSMKSLIPPPPPAIRSVPDGSEMTK